MGLNLKHAQYIMEIIKEGSITNASKTMHVSQPALSQTIKAVENILVHRSFSAIPNPSCSRKREKVYCCRKKDHHHQYEPAS